MTQPIDLVVRPARADDAAALALILVETFESTWCAAITAAAAEAWRREDRPRVYVAERGAEFRLAEAAGEVLGLVHWRGDFVHALHVRPAYARRGVGARLLDHAEGEIAAAGFACVRLETDTFNRPARAFYRARGYREAGRYPDKEWASGLTTILLVKRLTAGASYDCAKAAAGL